MKTCTYQLSKWQSPIPTY